MSTMVEKKANRQKEKIRERERSKKSDSIQQPFFKIIPLYNIYRKHIVREIRRDACALLCSVWVNAFTECWIKPCTRTEESVFPGVVFLVWLRESVDQ